MNTSLSGHTKAANVLSLLHQVPISSLNNAHLSAPPGPHLWDPRLPSIISVLDPALKRASLRRALSAGQHWRPWATPPGAVGRIPGGEESRDGIEKPLPGWWNKATAPKAAGGGPVVQGSAK